MNLIASSLLILSACKVDDPEEPEKLRAVSADRSAFSLLQLQGAYDSNEFASRLYEVSAEIRDKPVAEIPAIFDKHLTNWKSGAAKGNRTQASFCLVQANVDRSIEHALHPLFLRPSRSPLLRGGNEAEDEARAEGVGDFTRRAKTGFHVEHILSRNAENLALFDGDEERFDNERNRLGGVLLLKSTCFLL